MGSMHFRCGCGFTADSEHGDDPDAYFGTIDSHDPGNSCCNCGGQKCMDCVLRYMHDDCEDSCPDCCGSDE